MTELIAQGLYSLPEAARLLRVPRATVSRWAFGYRRRDISYQGAIKVHLPEVAGRRAINFLELVELFTIHEFRKAGAKWTHIRETFDHVSRALGTEYPFALERWFADPGGIYYQLEEDGPFVEASSGGQISVKVVLQPYLQQLEFDLEGLATRWFPQGKDVPVVIDREVAFGAPVVRGTAIETSVLAGMARAGESADDLAWWYGLDHHQVDAALEYERSLNET